MARLDAEAQKKAWSEAVAGDGAFYLERPAVFSSAAAAQDAANSSRMLWSWAPMWIPWEYTDWRREGRSFHDTAYIGDWSALVKVRFKGPQAFEFISYIGTNDLSTFDVGRVKHHVQVNEDGHVAAQGVLYRLAEDEFLYTGGSAYWAHYQSQHGDWDLEATVETSEHFLFSVQGPQSPTVIEEIAQAGIRDLRFNEWRELTIAGAPVRVLRTGITGEIGYELHGPCEAGNDVWTAVVAAGEPHGLLQLGVRAQMISHVEAGIASNDREFVSSAVNTGGQPQLHPSARSRIRGSYRPDDISDLFRIPAELNWFNQVSLDSHEFIGRDALRASHAAGGPARRLVGLVWNSADVVDVYATMFEPDPVRLMELPRDIGLAVDRLLVDGEDVGVSTSRVYSPYRSEMISLGHVDRQLTAPGTGVTVLWGEPGERQHEVRATVVELPFKEDVRTRDTLAGTQAS